MHSTSEESTGGRPFGRPSSWPERIALAGALLAWSLAVAVATQARQAAAPASSATLADADEGWLELRFQLARSDETGLHSLRLEPDWAGASRHASRDAGWSRIPLRARSLELMPARSPVQAALTSPSLGSDPTQRPSNDDATRPTAAGRLPAGAYDRVLVSTPEVEARFLDGRRTAVVSHIEPIARSFELAPGQTLAIEIDLILREGASNPLGQPEIFVMDARIVAPHSASAEVGP